nr:hypothetical protein [Nanoarchaeota archaeon]
MKSLIVAIILVLVMTASVHGEYGKDYWISCENNEEMQVWLKEDRNLEIYLVNTWTIADKYCDRDCLFYQAWAVDGMVCIEYKKIKGLNI